MKEIRGKSILVRVSARFELARVRVIGSQLYMRRVTRKSLPETLADKTPAHWPRPTENWWSDPQSELLYWHPETGPKLSADPRSTVFFKSANPLDLSPKSTICELFKAKSADPRTYSPPSFNFRDFRPRRAKILKTLKQAKTVERSSTICECIFHQLAVKNVNVNVVKTIYCQLSSIFLGKKNYCIHYLTGQNRGLSRLNNINFGRSSWPASCCPLFSALYESSCPRYYSQIEGLGLPGSCSSRARWALAPNFCSWATRKSQIFHTNHMLGTLDFTGSEQWAPSNFP